MNSGAVLVQLAGRYDYLGPALRRVADVLLRDPEAASALSITELAAEADTSEASVVRLAHELGFPGYRELRPALIAEVALRSRDDRVDGDLAEGDDVASVIAKIAAADIAAVQDTARALSAEALAQVVEALAAARRIDIYGVGASGIVAQDLQQKLTRIGRVSLAFADAHLGLTSAVLLGPDDVAIGISHSGATYDTVDPMRRAQERGATTIAVTNSAGSPLAELSDHVLLTAARETTFRSGATASRLAQLTVIDCMFVALAQRTFTDSEKALRATYDAVLPKRARAGR